MLGIGACREVGKGDATPQHQSSKMILPARNILTRYRLRRTKHSASACIIVIPEFNQKLGAGLIFVTKFSLCSTRKFGRKLKKTDVLIKHPYKNFLILFYDFRVNNFAFGRIVRGTASRGIAAGFVFGASNIPVKGLGNFMIGLCEFL